MLLLVTIGQLARDFRAVWSLWGLLLTDGSNQITSSGKPHVWADAFSIIATVGFTNPYSMVGEGWRRCSSKRTCFGWKESWQPTSCCFDWFLLAVHENSNNVTDLALSVFFRLAPPSVDGWSSSPKGCHEITLARGFTITKAQSTQKSEWRKKHQNKSQTIARSKQT